MEVLFNTIQTTVNSFDFTFCIVVNILTYLIIKYRDELKKDKPLSTWSKRLVLLIVIFSTGVLYYVINKNMLTIINSAILAPVFWSWIMKPICKYFDIDYHKINIEE